MYPRSYKLDELEEREAFIGETLPPHYHNASSDLTWGRSLNPQTTTGSLPAYPLWGTSSRNITTAQNLARQSIPGTLQKVPKKSQTRKSCGAITNPSRSLRWSATSVLTCRWLPQVRVVRGLGCLPGVHGKWFCFQSWRQWGHPRRKLTQRSASKRSSWPCSNVSAFYRRKSTKTLTSLMRWLFHIVTPFLDIISSWTKKINSNDIVIILSLWIEFYQWSYWFLVMEFETLLVNAWLITGSLFFQPLLTTSQWNQMLSWFYEFVQWVLCCVFRESMQRFRTLCWEWLNIITLCLLLTECFDAPLQWGWCNESRVRGDGEPMSGTLAEDRRCLPAVHFGRFQKRVDPETGSQVTGQR